VVVWEVNQQRVFGQEQTMLGRTGSLGVGVRGRGECGAADSAGAGPRSLYQVEWVGWGTQGGQTGLGVPDRVRLV
jgi:hypothetical protein